MTHPDDGTLRAYLDRELPDRERFTTHVHLDDCSGCTDRLSELEHTQRAVHDALALLNAPPDLERAWPRIELEMRRPRARRAWPGWSRAAGLVLLAGGGAAAALLPGSPLRPGSASDAVAPVPSAVAAPDAGAQAGVRAVGGTALLRVVVEAPSGTEVVVDIVDGASGLFAPRTSTFASEDGLLRAVATEGPLRIEIGAALSAATLELNGVAVLSVEDGRFVSSPEDASGNAPARRVRFKVP